MEHYGWISLVPALSVLIFALLTRRTLESLIVGSIIGFILLEKENFFPSFVDSSLAVMGDPTIGWLIFVVLFFGGFIALLVKSGGALAFGDFVSSKIKSKKSALLITWLMGLIIFIDDYINALTVSTSMQRITDKYKTSRELLAYVVDSTAAPICVLVPLSTWAIYVLGLFEAEGVADAGQGGMAYLQVVPFIFYGWVAIFVVLLTILGVIPKLGPMKTAELRAETQGICIPEGSGNISLVDDEIAAGVDADEKKMKEPKMINFFIPVIVLIAYTWYAGIDALQGVIVAVAVTIAMLFFQRIMKLTELFDTFIDGFKPMIYPIGILVASFILVDANEKLGLNAYVIEKVEPLMSSSLLPVVAFVSMGLVAFATGSFWGVYAVTLPIIIPLAEAIDANMWLSLGAVISAGAFGSHACPYGDATVLSATGSGIDTMTHVITQLPYILLSGAISALGYLILGFTL
ncbi:Na+/H+ antiporter NhaC family protein [Alteribacillus bidgolensis]|uniref:Transporter, NhaC family n=1 Tax=Alteribacillus bidgolensis TaxID=930129 RepID=A0A1G8NND7_9BACI|nr:Na+/H+ antiporter NhaC family protein [Alteribacillus bidgolensis]SDI81652.1 transporter, NhaC family [Alteribacillus bidgolensis]